MTERRIVAFNQVSADGYFTDADGGLAWVVSDPEIHALAVDDMPRTDTILFGRHTYEQFASFWPGALQNLDSSGPHGESKRDPAFSAMAHWLNDSRKLVFSRSLQQVEWHASELVDELTPGAVRALKQQPGKNILIFGSGSIVAQLSEHGLVDEYHFVVCPVLLGQGRNLLADLSQHVSLKLLAARAFGSGNVLLTYQRGAA